MTLRKFAFTAVLAAAAAAFPTADAIARDDDHGDHGQHHDHDHDERTQDASRSAAGLQIVEGRTLIVSVNGMVCDFCAQSLTKVLKKNRNVEKLAISLEEKTVAIVLREGGAMTDREVEKAVKTAGYNLAGIKRV